MHAIEENKPGLSQPFSINQTGTLLTRHLAHFVSAIDTGERTGRVVRGVELAPAYVDLAIARWRMLYPDQSVTLSGDGRDYDTVAAARAEVADAA